VFPWCISCPTNHMASLECPNTVSTNRKLCLVFRTHYGFIPSSKFHSAHYKMLNLHQLSLKLNFYPSFCVPINKSHRFWNKRNCLFSFTTMPFSWKAVIFWQFWIKFCIFASKFLHQKCKIYPKMLNANFVKQNWQFLFFWL